MKNETGLNDIIIKIYQSELKYAKNQTYKMCLEAVKRNGSLLKDIRWDELHITKDQIYNLYLTAVKWKSA